VFKRVYAEHMIAKQLHATNLENCKSTLADMLNATKAQARPIARVRARPALRRRACAQNEAVANLSTIVGFQQNLSFSLPRAINEVRVCG
jgi:hypothetical protein